MGGISCSLRFNACAPECAQLQPVSLDECTQNFAILTFECLHISNILEVVLYYILVITAEYNVSGEIIMS